MKPVFVIAVLAVAMSSAAFGQTKGAETGADSLALAVVQAVLQTEFECDRALMQGDISRLEYLVYDGATRTDPSGAMIDKAQWIETVREGRVKYVSIEREDIKVRTYGGVAVITGIVDIKWQSNGREDDSRNRYLRVYVNRQGRWQLVAHQATRIARP